MGETEKDNIEKLTESDLENAAGGNGWPQGELHLAQPEVEGGGYLAVRSYPSWDDSNEIAQIWPGNRFYVDVQKMASGSGYNFYWANYNGIWGWVNAGHLKLLD